MKRTRIAAILTIAAALCTPGLNSAPAAADPVPPPSVQDRTPEGPPPADGALLTAEQAPHPDADAVAALAGVPVAETRRRLALQAKVARFIESLPADVRATSFAAGRFDFSAGRPAILYFKGTVPDAVRALAPAEVALTGGMMYSFDELTARQNAIHAAVERLGFRQIVSSVDVTTQHITLDVALERRLPSLRGQRLRDAITTSLAATPHKVTGAEFSLVEHPPATVLFTPQYGYGGAGFRDDNVTECTSAFVVRRTSDGSEGLLTAAHCEGLNKMEENNTSGGVVAILSAPFVSEHIGVNGDVEWHTTVGHDDLPQFWAEVNRRRTVTSRITNTGYTVGSYACHYGRTSGYSCGTIHHLNRDITFHWGGCGCSRTAYNLVGVRGATADGGDSGGPWFLGYEAYGIMEGEIWRPPDYVREQVFSRIQRAESQFGVRVQFA